MTEARHPVLVVDDDDAIRRFIVAVLSRSGYATREARNGDEAIALLEQDGFEAVLLDLMMPVRSGYEVIEFLRREHPGRECVVIMTAAGTRGTSGIDRSSIHSILY
ncbi:MAG TPA: response regulator [Thermoanaerobaculia bacterium]|nr:response regulator [Thermoanaerobaculia bacterium]